MTENHIIFQENPNRKINLHRYEEIKQECRTNSKRKFKQYARWCQVNVNEKYKIEVLFSNSSEIFEHDNTTYFHHSREKYLFDTRKIPDPISS